MTRDELKDLACLGFSADMVMQSFCHTAAYPKLVDVQDAPRTAELHQHPWRRRAASGRRRHPLLAQPPAAARHRRHRRRLAHALPDRHLVPGRLRPGRLCRRHRRHAARHAGIGAGALQGLAHRSRQARRHAARPGQCDSLLRDPGRPADRREEGQEEHLLGPHPGNRRAAGSQGRTGLRTLRRRCRTFRRRLRGGAEQGTDHRVHALEHHADEVDDRQRLLRRAHPRPPHQGDGSLDRQTRVAEGRRRRAVRGGDRDRPRRRARSRWSPARTTRTTSSCSPQSPAPRSTRSSSARA
jgi:hypothetical protein